MWKHAGVSVRGSAHEVNGLPCQDATAIQLLGKDQNLLMCALSDGAGSAKYSDEASRFLVAEALRYFGRQLADHPEPARLLLEYDLSDGRTFLEEAQEGLQRMADSRGTPVREFSATVLFAALHPECSVFLQVGDGCWTVVRNGIYGAVTWPAQGEFAGQTDFVTSSSAAEALQMETILGPLDSVVGITDGLERLALNLQGGVPSPRFFSPFLRDLEISTDFEAFKHGLVAFLQSERVCERTDDDKSVVLISANAERLR